jgi:hypothetical protein
LRRYWSVSTPKTSAKDSFSAPGWSWYSKAASCWTTPWVSSWAITSTCGVNGPNTSPSPSPNTICCPSQKAFMYLRP